MDKFEYTVEVPSEDGDSVSEVTFQFKPIKMLPVGILRKHRRDVEGQMWATFEWGLSPEQLELFDRLPASKFREILNAWQASGDDKDETSEEE
ncbi:hypothetical protein PXH78_26965 [Mycolicibacterium smegmatis]|uniref:hypothetical protein n=1 Tax=Mycolicibacterium smegmatis TaxID=1772 RepID=UPI0005D9A4CA|nr:hypothetical protein [Mycolicibacterium smegmatis]MDF1902754.1 hypothetical protein [Mycolicibacterium smegmatis]MDF1909030.1 hypothetical protein [Mycolicibacterium smegmatis]MDF1921249.1 hypothetical protein [Mycolicibacterium smegmatis]MDF1927514.1 hypothetical protein [Mycolicibacterium smegmatis]UAK53371.1 hypothetical protein K8P01_22525 [Mycolicibacterium smegmatis]